MPSSPLSASIVGRKHSPSSRKSPKNSARVCAGTLPDTVPSFVSVTNISLPALNNSLYLPDLDKPFYAAYCWEWQIASVCNVCYRKPLDSFLGAPCGSNRSPCANSRCVLDPPLKLVLASPLTAPSFSLNSSLTASPAG